MIIATSIGVLSRTFFKDILWFLIWQWQPQLDWDYLLRMRYEMPWHIELLSIIDPIFLCVEVNCSAVKWTEVCLHSKSMTVNHICICCCFTTTQQTTQPASLVRGTVAERLGRAFTKPGHNYWLVATSCGKLNSCRSCCLQSAGLTVITIHTF